MRSRNIKTFKLVKSEKKLEARQIPQSEIRTIVKSVDYEVQKSAVAKSASNVGNELVLVGVITIVFGILIVPFILIGNGVFFWEIGIFISGGASLVTTGFAKKKRIKKN